MEIIYKWKIIDYKWDLKLQIRHDVTKEFFSVNDIFLIEIKRKFSEKKQKYFAKIQSDIWESHYDFIIFKNWYIIIWKTIKYKKEEWDIEF